jgi:ABC-type nitrate/sulfonate/bicarbonate transport system substrate-binding protein
MKTFTAAGLLLMFCLTVASAGAQDKPPFLIAASSKTLGYGPLWIAWKKGFFSQQGLNGQVILLRGTPMTVQALAADSVFVGCPTPEAVAEARERGLDLEIIGGVINGLTHAIVGGKKYKTYEELRGATLGSLSLTSGITFALKQVLKTKGLDYPKDYKLINVGGTPELFAALTSGQIAAAPLAIPLNLAAEEAGLNVIGWYRDVLPNYQLTLLAVKRSWGEENRPLVVRFMKAMALAMHWTYQNREAAIAFLSQEMKLKPEHARKGWEYYTNNRIWHPDADVNLEGIRVTLQILRDNSGAKGPMPAAASYVNQSYLKEALKELATK